MRYSSFTARGSESISFKTSDDPHFSRFQSVPKAHETLTALALFYMKFGIGNKPYPLSSSTKQNNVHRLRYVSKGHGRNSVVF